MSKNVTNGVYWHSRTLLKGRDTTISKPDLFPEGAEVGAYASEKSNGNGVQIAFVRPMDTWPSRGQKPPAPLRASAVVENGVATFEDLPFGGYFFAAKVDGEWRCMAGRSAIPKRILELNEEGST